MTFIECCLANVTPDARTNLQESDARVREAFCLDRCGTCCETPFLIVDGEFRDGESFSDLLATIEGRGKREER